MLNIVQRVEGSKLILEVDLSQNLGPSESGKTYMVANSKGFQRVDGFTGKVNAMPVSFSLNVCEKRVK